LGSGRFALAAVVSAAKVAGAQAGTLARITRASAARVGIAIDRRAHFRCRRARTSEALLCAPRGPGDFRHLGS
jgi:hypothetical protein